MCLGRVSNQAAEKCCDGAELRIEAGQAHYCPEGHEHSLINDTESDLVFFAVVPQQ